MFLGTLDPQPLVLGVNARPALRLDHTPFAPNIVAGHAANHSGDSVVGAAIGGGGDAAAPNRVTADFGTVGGGLDNTAGGDQKFVQAPFATIGGGRANRVERRHGTVGGGINNRVSGQSGSVAGGSGNRADGDFGTVAGGTDNAAAERHATVGGGHTNAALAEASTVGGGRENRVAGLAGTIAGGALNRADGDYAAIPGGLDNEASARGGFAAGTHAKSRHPGAFVWADGTQADFASTAPNQFLLRASGNVGIDHNRPAEKLTVAGNIAPGDDDRHTLGTDRLRWRFLNLSGGIDYVGNLTVSDEGTPRLKLDEAGNLLVAGRVITSAFSAHANDFAAGGPPPAAASTNSPPAAALPSKLQQFADHLEETADRTTLLSDQVRVEGELAVRGPILANQGLVFPDGTTILSAKQPDRPPDHTKLVQDLAARMRTMETAAPRLDAFDRRLTSLERAPKPSPTNNPSNTADSAAVARLDARTKLLADDLRDLARNQEQTTQRLAQLHTRRAVATNARPEVTRADLEQLRATIRPLLAAPPTTSPGTQSLARVVAEIARLDRQLATISDAIARSNTAKPPEIAVLTRGLADLRQQVARLKPAPAADTARIDRELRALRQQFAALPPATDTNLASEVAELKSDLAAIDLQPLHISIQQISNRVATLGKPSARSADILAEVRGWKQAQEARLAKLEAAPKPPALTPGVSPKDIAELQTRLDAVARDTARTRSAAGETGQALEAFERRHKQDLAALHQKIDAKPAAPAAPPAAAPLPAPLQPGSVGLAELDLLQLDQRYLARTRDRITLRKGEVRTEADTPFRVSIDGQPILRLRAGNLSAPTLLAGDPGNEAGDFAGVAVSGGGRPGAPQQAEGDFASIGGGYGNHAGARATVAGGSGNQARGDAATVPGGADNQAVGRLSLAAGHRAHALHEGSFVWADSQDADQSSARADQFVVRAAGGVAVHDQAGRGPAAQIPPGTTAWHIRADARDLAEAKPVDPIDVLGKALAVPVRKHGQRLAIAAEDFEAKFQTGTEPGYLDTASTDAVLLASVQGMLTLIEEQQQQINQLIQRIDTLERGR